MSQNIFATIKAHVPIVDLIHQYTSLKRAGLYWKGRCPFHQEKTASFTVSPHIQIFYCFGCHESGDVIGFFAKIEQCSQLEAAKELGKKYGIDLPEQYHDHTAKKNETSYYEICTFFAEWCTKQLATHTPVLEYFTSRGFTQLTLKKFNIGCMPGGLRSVQQLIEEARKQYILVDDLVSAGIITQAKSVFYSPYEDRVIFPITDHQGRVCGFGGRVYKIGDERAKYYNSRDSEYFAKGTLLFGLHYGKKAIQEKGTVYLVEGYTDCMAMAQHGFEATVATLGTACTQTHLKVLSRYAHEIVIVYDSDNAGMKAINRIAQMCWQANIEPFVVTLPMGHDPASFLAEKRDLTSYLHAREDIFLHFIRSQSTQFVTLSLENKLQIVKNIVETIGAVEDPIKQNILINQAAESLSLQAELLKNELKKIKNPLSIPVFKKKTIPIKRDTLKIEKKVFVAIMNNVGLLEKPHISLLIAYLPDLLRTILLRLKEWSMEKKPTEISFASFFNALDEHHKRAVSTLLFAYEEPVDEATFDGLIMQLKKKWWKTIAKQIKNEVVQAEREGDTQKVARLLSDFVALQNQIIMDNNT